MSPPLPQVRPRPARCGRAAGPLGRLGAVLFLVAGAWAWAGIGAGVVAGQPGVVARVEDPPLLAILVLLDGSDRIEITAEGLRWHHRHWDPPRKVAVNGRLWDVHATPLLSFDELGLELDEATVRSLRLRVRHARDLVTAERTLRGVDIHLVDTPGGAHAAVFELRVPEESEAVDERPPPAAPRGAPRLPDALRVTGMIDNRFTLRLDATGLSVVQGPYETLPATLQVNGRTWRLADGPLRNAGTTRFLAPVTFGQALVAERRARDVVTVATEGDALLLQVADSLPGASAFDVTIVFPARPRRAR